MPAFNLATDIYGLILTYFILYASLLFLSLFIYFGQAITIFLTFWSAIFLFLFQFDIFIHYFIYRLLYISIYTIFKKIIKINIIF